MSDDVFHSPDDEAVREQIVWLFTGLLTTFPGWVYRRVETVELPDDESVSRRVSVDFELPSVVLDNAPEGVPLLVPLALLQKTPLISFDLRNATGDALPVLTKTQNGTLVVEALLGYARALLDHPRYPDRSQAASMIEDQLRRIVLGDPTSAAKAMAALRVRLALHRELGMQLAALIDDEGFLGLVEQFVENYVLVTPMADPRRGRAIVKYRYIETYPEDADERGALERIGDRLGWTPDSRDFQAFSASAAESYHIEVCVPHGLAITEGTIYSKTDRASSAFVLSRAGRSTIHMSTDEQMELAVARINTRASRSGWLRACMFTAWAVVILMVGTGFVLDDLFARQDSGNASSVDAAAVFLTVVAIAGAYVVRPGEHALTSRRLFWIRGVVLVCVSMPFVGAWVLAFGSSSWEWLWWVLAIVSLCCASVLVRSFYGPRLLPQDPDRVP